MQTFINQFLAAIQMDLLLQELPAVGYMLCAFASIVALFLCFSGYRLKSEWFFFICAFCGTFVASWVNAQMAIRLWPSVGIGLAATVILCSLSKLRAPILAFGTGYFLLTSLTGIHGLYILGICAILAIAAYLRDQLVLPELSAFLGAMLFLDFQRGLHPLIQTILPDVSALLNQLRPSGRLGILLIAALGILGSLAQTFQLYTSRPRPRGEG